MSKHSELAEQMRVLAGEAGVGGFPQTETMLHTGADVITALEAENRLKFSASEMSAVVEKVAKLEADLASAVEALKQARLAIEGLAKIADPNHDPSGVMEGPTIARIDAELAKHKKETGHD